MPDAGQADLLRSPLSGIRVLDFTRFLSGGYATWILAELGADVIKVEDVDRPDEGRVVGPHFIGEQSLYFAALNTGKRSVAIRLRDPAGRDVALRLAEKCDVVIENHRPGAMARHGLGSTDLLAVNPSLITCSLSGYGATGPLRGHAGYDYTIQALAGVMSMTGEPDGPPGKAGVSYVDHSGGLAAALAISSALVGRASRGGQGGHIDLALYDVQLSMLSYLAAWHLNAGYQGGRTASASHPSLVPAQNFATADGHVAVFVGNDLLWERMAKALDDPVLEVDEFRTTKGRFEGREVLLGRLDEIFASGPSQQWIDLLDRHGVPCVRVNSLQEALAEPQASARELLRHTAHPDYGSYRHIGGPIPSMADRNLSAAPLLGEHTAEVLSELGTSSDAVADLLARGIVQRRQRPADQGQHVPHRGQGTRARGDKEV